MERTYVFDNNDGGCGGNGMMGLIASLCQQRGMDPNMVAAMMNNRNNGFGGEGGWFIWVIFLFFLMGWGNGGFGGFGRNGQGEGNFLAGQLANDTGRELLQQAINGNGQAISQLASTLNCDVNAIQTSLNQLNQAICNVGSQVGMTAQQTQNAIINGNCQLASQLSSCCCDLRAQIADFKGDLSLQMCQQTGTLSNGQRDITAALTKGFCDATYATREQTCELKNDITALKTFLAEKFSQQEFREMQRENQNLRDRLAKCELSDSQRAQTTDIVSQLQPVPRPAYIVGSPYQTYGYPYGYPYGYNGNGCCNNNCGNNCGGCGCN